VSAIASDDLNQVREILGSIDALSAEGDLSNSLDGFIRHVRHSEGYMVSLLNPSALYELSSIAAPVFDRSGHVALATTLQGFTEPTEPAKIEQLGERLVAAADSVTAAVNLARPSSRVTLGGPRSHVPATDCDTVWVRCHSPHMLSVGEPPGFFWLQAFEGERDETPPRGESGVSSPRFASKRA
jgi:hypothetical protein